MHEVVIPFVGVAMDEAVLSHWVKAPGDSVVTGEVLAEIETDKTTLPLESPADGILGAHLLDEGSSAAPGTVVVRVYGVGESVGEPASAAPTDTDDDATNSMLQSAPATSRGESDGNDGKAAHPAEKPQRLSPRARRLADEAATAASSADASASATAARSGRFRALIAERVAVSWREIPHFAVSREIDARELLAELQTVRATTPNVTVTDLLLRALAHALSTASPEPVTGDISLAVATDAGVVLVTIEDALELDLSGIAQQRADAVERARTGQLTAADLDPAASATLSNLGAYGVDRFTGIISSGQLSLLTVGRISERAAVVDGALAVRRRFDATLNVDHRRLDGADAARLLQAFSGAIEGAATA